MAPPRGLAMRAARFHSRVPASRALGLPVLPKAFAAQQAARSLTEGAPPPGPATGASSASGLTGR
eukprot:9841622-Alexandrium_andersonii.AAC.1